MAILLGLSAKLYYFDPESADTRPSPSAGAMTTTAIAAVDFLVMNNCTDVTVNMSKSEADITTRGANGWRAKKGTLKEGSLDFEMLWDTADSSFLAFQAAFLGDYPITMLALDQAHTNAHATGPIVPQGIYADFEVLNFEKSEALEDAQRVSVSLSVTTGGELAELDPVVLPQWVTISPAA